MIRSIAVSFDWDKGDIDKSYRKHGISPNEAEEVFLDTHVLAVPDIYHSALEKRMVAIGITAGKRVLFVVFTQRGKKIRIISARKANKKERSIYENKAV